MSNTDQERKEDAEKSLKLFHKFREIYKDDRSYPVYRAFLLGFMDLLRLDLAPSEARKALLVEIVNDILELDKVICEIVGTKEVRH